MKDIKTRLGFVQLLAPADVAGVDTASALLDLKGFEGCTLSVLLGVLTGVDATHFLMPVLQESNTTANGDFTAVTAADIEGAFTLVDNAAEDVVVQTVGYKGSKRYVRVNLDFTNPGGALSASLVSVLGVLGSAHDVPVVSPAAVAAT